MRNQNGMVVVLLAGLGILAGVSDGAEKAADAKMPALVKPSEPTEIQPLGRTLELIFKIKDGDLPALSVNCSTDRYAIQTQFEGAQGYANIDISGRLVMLENGKLLITFQALVDFEGGDGSIHASSMGSTQAAIGSEARMMTIAGKSLVVQVKPVVDAPVATNQ